LKNKGLTYGLIVVVGVIWYQVFVRVKSNFEAEEVVPVAVESTLGKRSVQKLKAFRLQANYRDPFTGKLAATDPPTSTVPDPNAALPAPPKPKPEPVIIQWPAIRYYGLVRKTTAKDPRTLVSIDGNIYKVKQGEQLLDNILILKVTRDYVQIRYKKEVRTFERKK
jgi:hypothetical protein